MNRLRYAVQLDYDIQDDTADLILNIEAAATACQTVVQEHLQLPAGVTSQRYTDPLTATRWLRLQAPRGTLSLRYEATVDVEHRLDDPASLQEVPVAELPFELLPFIAPSRYAESDRLRTTANSEFGDIPPGYERVAAIRNWVHDHVEYRSQSSSETTSAADTLVQRTGVCRDYANLMVALCRALNIPARLTTSLDYGKSPDLGPSDFHAVVEVYLSGHWYLFDPSGVAITTGLLRIGTGRDTSDVPFASLFGDIVPCAPPIIEVEPVTEGGREMPVFTPLAICTW